MNTSHWEIIGSVAGVLTTLIGIPMTAIVFYCRSIREDQRHVQMSMTQTVDRIEREYRRIGIVLQQAERRFATKNEWLREAGLTRAQLSHLTELLVRLEAEWESSGGLATRLTETTQALAQLAEHLCQRSTSPTIAAVEEA